MTRRMPALVLAALVWAGVLPAGAAPLPCNRPLDPWGDWPMPGRDLEGTRHQEEENAIGPVEAATLSPEWTFSPRAAGGDGDFTGTPVVDRGCVYVGSSTGWVFAVDADTGKLAWARRLDAAGSGAFAGGIPGSLAVAGRRLLVNVNRSGSLYTAALDARTGALLWQTIVDTHPAAGLFASPVVLEGVVFVGISAFGGGEEAFCGSFALLDLASGRILRKTHTIPPQDCARGFTGGGIFTSPAVDPATRYAYAGTGGPRSGDPEHERANAVLKVDLDRRRPTFGDVVSVYKDTMYRDVPGVSAVHFMFEFGATPNLFTDARRGSMFGVLQKSGEYHAVDAATMRRIWRVPISSPALLGNISSGAYDGRSLYTSANPGVVASLGPDSGGIRWAASTVDAIRVQPLAAANGVVYTLDAAGSLHAFDADRGVPLLARPLLPETAPDAAATLGGVSVARHTVFATVGVSAWPAGYLIALRPST